MGAGSEHSVKAMPFGAASRALTFMPWLPASYTRGRRTRKPPAGAPSKEARRPETQKQQHKKCFLSLTVFPHTDTRRTRYMQTRLDSYTTRHSRHIRCYRSPCAQMPAQSRSSCRPYFEPDTGRRCFVWCSGSCHIPSSREPDACPALSPYLSVTRRMQPRSTPDTHPPHFRCPHHASPFPYGCLFIRPALSPRASLRFVYTLRV